MSYHFDKTVYILYFSPTLIKNIVYFKMKLTQKDVLKQNNNNFFGFSNIVQFNLKFYLKSLKNSIKCASINNSEEKLDNKFRFRL